MAGVIARARLAPRAQRGVDALWRLLRRPWLAMLLATALLALLLLARLIRQIPGQAAEDPASALRWLNAERDAWGAWGGILRALGLFHVTGSWLFFGLVALLALICAVQLAAALHGARLPARLHAALDAPPGADPLPLGTPDGLRRTRVPLSAPPATAVDAVAAQMEAAIGPPRRREVAPPDGADEAAAPPAETRLLAAAGLRGLALRPLLPAGALLALGVLWWIAVFGWGVRPAPLAPGDGYAYAPHSVAITYTAPLTGAAQLLVGVGEDVVTLPARAAQARVGGANVSARPGAPALLLRAPDPVLALPGAPEPRAEAGLVFAQPGSEQIVLLPASGAGVRVVRLPQANARGFLVEVYARDGVQPIQRVEITAAQILTLPLAAGEIPLALTPMDGLDVTVRRAPGAWLLWPALALAVAGLAGSLWWRPAFALAQLRPWPTNRTVLTLQTNHATLLETLTRQPD